MDSIYPGVVKLVIFPVQRETLVPGPPNVLRAVTPLLRSVTFALPALPPVRPPVTVVLPGGSLSLFNGGRARVRRRLDGPSPFVFHVAVLEIKLLPCAESLVPAPSSCVKASGSVVPL